MSKKRSRPETSTSAPNQEAFTRQLNSNDAGGLADMNSTFEGLRENIQAKLQRAKVPVEQKKRAESSKKDAVSAKVVGSEGLRGKKRDNSGNIIKGPIEKRSGPATQRNGLVHSEGSEEDETTFQNEVRALGGTIEDIELVANADSDSELEGDVKMNNGKSRYLEKNTDLEKGISNILKEIALSQGLSEGSIDSSEHLDEEQIGEEREKPLTNGKDSLKQQIQPLVKIKGLKCQPCSNWFELGEVGFDLEKTTKYTVSNSTLEQLHKFAKKLLEEENASFELSQKNSSSKSFYNTVIASGTLSDKISALTLAVQESPVHNIKALETLIGLSKKRSRSQAVDVLRALKDLLAQGSLLPNARRLFSFNTQPALLVGFGGLKSWKEGDRLPKGISESNLISWAFESWLKEQYFEIIKTLEIWCNDEIEFSKSRAISYVYELLKEKPEQESNLLRLLINKLGDPIKKIASQASYLLMQLLSAHPAMKDVVISAIETDFIFRPGQSLHAKYYAAVTLNQTALSAHEEGVAVRLLGIYFGLFTTLLKTGEGVREDAARGAEDPRPQGRHKPRKQIEHSGQAQTDELREKLTSAILTGVNRAYPYAGSDNQSFTQHLDTLFKITHSSNFNTSIQAMLLIQQLSSTHQPSSDRFYRVLYESLLDPRLINASKQQLYLNLIHRSLKADLNVKRVKAFVKRILQILSLHEPPFICGVFFLLKDLETTYPSLTALVDQAENGDDEEEVFRDVEEDNDEGVANTDEEVTLKSAGYNAHKRAPEHANADKSCVWEVLPFLAHYHPSVATSADHYLRHVRLPGKPDLTLHTLIHFLDRFVYRNAKLADAKLRGSSIMQPMASDNTHAVLFTPTIGGGQRQAVNSEEFKKRRDTEIAAEDVFFHKYFSALGKEPAKKSKKARLGDEDGDESADEDEVWKAMMESAPDLEGEGSSDEDMGMSDLESDLDEAMDYDSSEEEIDAVKGEGIDVEAGIFDESDDGLLEMADGDAFRDEDAVEAVESEEESEINNSPGDAKKTANKAKKEQRKKLKAMPVFASAADYARMLDDDQDEDLG